MILPALAILSLGAQAPPMPPLEHPVLPQLYRTPSYGPVLAEVSLGVRVKPRADGAVGTVTLPVPTDYNGQVVYSFRVQSDPPQSLKSWKCEVLPGGLNRVLRAEVAPPSSGALVSWTARVIMPGEGIVRTQRKDFASWMSLAPPQPWLRAAAARGLAEIRAARKEETDLPGDAAMWTARYRDTWRGANGSKPSASDGSDSLNRALLCVSMLRAMKVPARVVSYLPVLLAADARPRWMTEYKSDEGTWETLDPMVGIRVPMRNSALVLSIPAMDAEGALASSKVAAEMCDASVSPTLSIAPDAADWQVTDRVIGVYRWADASRLVPVARIRGRMTQQSALQGKADWIDDASFDAAISKGPTNLALFLMGRPGLPGRPRG